MEFLTSPVLAVLFTGICTLAGVFLTSMFNRKREFWTWRKDAHREVLRCALPMGPVVTKENYQKGNLHTQLERCLQEFRDGFYPEVLFMDDSVLQVCKDLESILQVIIRRLMSESDNRNDEAFNEIQRDFLACYNAVMPVCKVASKVDLSSAEQKLITDYERQKQSV